MKLKIAASVLFLTASLTACNKPAETTATNDSQPTVAADPVTPNDAPAEPAIQTLTGTYVALDQGDYYHVAIKGDDGTDYSYWIAPDFPEARFSEMEEGMWDGKKVKIKWRKTERDVEEAGGKIEVDEIVDIEAI